MLQLLNIFSLVLGWGAGACRAETTDIIQGRRSLLNYNIISNPETPSRSIFKLASPFLSSSITAHRHNGSVRVLESVEEVQVGSNENY